MKVKRIQELEEFIHAEGHVSIDELCLQFHVSKNTIRRDLNKLVEDGIVAKVYGGVSSLSRSANSFKKRIVENEAEKKQIAKKAAEMIEDQDMIYIDSGTTTCHLVQFIDPNHRVTIITNSLDVLNQSVHYPNCKVLLLGNTFKRPTRSFVNVRDWPFFERLNINKSFMSAAGISLERGVTNSDVYEYTIKQQILQKSLKNHLLVDSSKFNKAALVTFAQIADFDRIYTDHAASQAIQSYCEKEKVELIDSQS